MITQRELKELLHYNPDTGHFTWAKGRQGVAAGSRAGTATPKGYIRIQLRKKNWMAHRLAWLWMTGEWPAAEVDHKDTDRGNNRWDNLRLATHTENQWNTGVRADNVSGSKGVTRPRGRTRWHAYITEGGRRRFLGSFPTVEEANQAAIAARQAAHGEFAR